MSKLKAKIISRILFLAMLLTSVTGAISCGDNADTNDTNTNTSAGDTTSAPESEGPLTDNVPKLDFGGAEFRTIDQQSMVYTLYSAEMNGDIVNDAIFERNKKIEERFNVTFTETPKIDYGEISKMVKQSVMSDSDDFDLVFGQMYKTANDAVDGLLYDWSAVPHVDFSKPWYVKDINSSSIGGKLYMIESDLCNGYFEQTWMMLYNKSKAEDYPDFPNMYDVVDEGKWTLDMLNNLSADMYEDLDGNSQRDSTDFYGFAGTTGACMLAAVVYGANGRLVELDSDLNVVDRMKDERTVDVLTKLSKLIYENNGSIPKNDSLGATRRELFPKGTIMFEVMQVNDLIRADFDLRNANFEFGVLPLPKYDEEQEEYYTVVDGGASVMCIPKTARNIDMIGAITEAMSAASYNEVVPVYSGLAVEQKGTRDDESIRMLRQILDSRVLDFGYLYSGSNGNEGWVMRLPNIIKNNSSIVSSIESAKNAVEAYYNGVIDYMTNQAE